MNGDIVLIEWVDSRYTNCWECLGEIEAMPPSVCHAVGFLIDDSVDYKTLAISLSPNTDQVLGRLTIPSGCIRSIRKLRKYIY